MLEYNELKSAIFFSKESPDKLAAIIYKMYKDANPPYIHAATVTGAGTVTLKADESATSTYAVEYKDQYGTTITGGTAAWSLKSAVEGASINSSTGVLTLTKDVVAEKVTVVATTTVASHPDVIAEKEISILPYVAPEGG